MELYEINNNDDNVKASRALVLDKYWYPKISRFRYCNRKEKLTRLGKRYLGLKHPELAAASGPAEELASVPGGDAGVLGDPLLHVPVGVQVVGAVVLLALLLPEALG